MKIRSMEQSRNIDSLPIEFSADTGDGKYPRIMEHLAQVAAGFINMDVEDIDSTIDSSIARIGTVLEIDQICTYVLDQDGTGFLKLLQWNADPLHEMGNTMGRQSLADFPWLKEHTLKNKTIIIDCISDLGAVDNAIARALKDQGILTALIVPLAWRSTVAGFFCVGSISGIRQWEKTEVYAFELLASSVAGALKHKAIDLELIRSKENLRSLNSKLESQIRERTQDLEESLERLQKSQETIVHQEKLASIGLLSAGIAHEINNPTGYIMSNLHILKIYFGSFFRIIDEYETLSSLISSDESAAKKKLGVIDRLKNELDFEYAKNDSAELVKESIEGTERIKSIVVALQGYARNSDKGMELVSIEKLIDRAIKLSWNELKFKCDIHKSYSGLPFVPARENELLQVFINLLMNASQAIDTKGTISIETKKIGDSAKVVFSDTGKGIDPKHLHMVMDPFFTTKPTGQGTGLGLTISRNIIIGYGGNIQVESSLGKGAVFTITIPLPAKDQQSQEGKSTKGRTHYD